MKRKYAVLINSIGGYWSVIYNDADESTWETYLDEVRSFNKADEIVKAMNMLEESRLSENK